MTSRAFPELLQPLYGLKPFLFIGSELFIDQPQLVMKFPAILGEHPRDPKHRCYSKGIAIRTLWHEIITKIIPWELFFVIFEAFCPLKMSRKERHFQGITREIRNFPKIIIKRKCFVSNKFVSEGMLSAVFPTFWMSINSCVFDQVKPIETDSNWLTLIKADWSWLKMTDIRSTWMEIHETLGENHAKSLKIGFGDFAWS